MATHGGGVASGRDSIPTLDRCVIMGNWAREGGEGGGVFVGGGGVLINCLVAGNLAEWEGGVFSRGSVEVIHSTVTGNWSPQVGPGVSCYTHPGFENEGTTDVLNSIVWENSWGPYCGPFRGSLLDADPLFVRPGVFDFERTIEIEIAGRLCVMPDFIVDEGEYRLQPGSPAVDGGVLEGAAARDIEGNARPCGDGVDIGAYEQEGCSVGAEPRFTRGDASGDGALDLSDAISVLQYLFSGGDSPGCEKAADANDSGEVDISDPLYVLGFLFLGTPPPREPFRACAPDPTLDGITCELQHPCAGTTPP